MSDELEKAIALLAEMADDARADFETAVVRYGSDGRYEEGRMRALDEAFERVRELRKEVVST